MKKARRRFLLFVFACWAALVALGTEPPQPERRVLPVSVLDREGRFVEGLTAANFRGEFRGQPVKILSANLDTDPRRIAIVVDVSASMDRPKAKWEFAWELTRDLVSHAVPRHSVSLVAFRYWEAGGRHGHEREGLAEFTKNNELLVRAQIEMRTKGPKGATVLYDAIVELTRGWPPGGLGDVLMLISDGIDTLSRSSETEAEIAPAERGIRVFTLVLPPAPDENPWYTRRGRRWARQIASMTGGLAADLTKSKKSPSIEMPQLSGLYDSIEKFYRIEVEFPAALYKQKEWKLEVVDENGKKRKDVEVTYPRLVVPPTHK